MKTFFTRTSFVFVVLFMSAKAQAVTHVVTQSNLTFSPSTFTCNVGDVVRWEWTSGSHTTQSFMVPQGASSWDADLTQGTPFFEYTVQVAGHYTYSCPLHAIDQMTGAFDATVASSVEPILASPRYMKVGIELGSKMLHISTAGGESVNGAIKVYDIAGKSAATVFEGNFGSGEKLFEYDGNALGRGLYFVRFEAGNNVVTRKIMLN